MINKKKNLPAMILLILGLSAIALPLYKMCIRDSVRTINTGEYHYCKSDSDLLFEFLWRWSCRNFGGGIWNYQ